MTENELIRELEEVLRKAKDIINRQKTEIDILIRKNDTLRDELAEQQAEIERLQNTLDDVLDREPVLVERSEKYAKSEAIKEFAREFEKRCIAGGIYPAFVKQQLHDVKKEMTENNFKEEINNEC